jgi:cellulose synthase/poly-beta-1,6-N-acetylglucosamine synthase-like glycosyltransferase
MPHFHTASLREIGGWDAYNVTEDADLGMRLARLGYLAGMISSTTYEEAPARFGPWLRQRTRWFKGWMQTLGCRAFSPSSSSSAAMCWPRWCTRCSWLD